VEEYLRFPLWLQAILVTLLAVVLAVIVLSIVEGAADWIVLGAIVVAAAGTAIAITTRRYPTRKRAFTKDADSKW
jgi:hypothetical protein